MKTKSLLLAVCAAAALVGTSTAATITVSRGAGNLGIVASNLDGTALSAGGYYIAVGTFTNASLATEVPTIIPGDFASLYAAVQAFDVFGSTTSPTTGTTMGTITAVITGLGGADPNVFNTKQMFFLVGNKATQALSEQFAIFKMVPDKFFPANVTVTGSTAVAMPNSSVIQMVPGAGELNGANGFKMAVAVPETSAALLGALGALGLLRRRR